jgi:hypothetical protein
MAALALTFKKNVFKTTFDIFHWKTIKLMKMQNIQLKNPKKFKHNLVSISFCPTTCGLSETSGFSSPSFLDPCNYTKLELASTASTLAEHSDNPWEQST